MTNKEFYWNKLLTIVIWNQHQCQLLHEMVFGKLCLGKNCGVCEFSTAESIENWLNAEHEELEPPLLENGDSLKPGDCRDVDFYELAEVAATTIMEIQRGETRCFMNNADVILDVLEWFGLRVHFKMWEKGGVSYYSLGLDDYEDCYLGGYLATWGGK